MVVMSFAVPLKNDCGLGTPHLPLPSQERVTDSLSEEEGSDAFLKSYTARTSTTHESRCIEPRDCRALSKQARVYPSRSAHVVRALERYR
jgi:hypothetical protein